MDILQALQTLGICVGALALVAIAIMMFFVLMSFVPALPPEIDIEDLTPMNLDRSAPRKKRRNKKDDPATEADDKQPSAPE